MFNSIYIQDKNTYQQLIAKDSLWSVQNQRPIIYSTNTINTNGYHLYILSHLSNHLYVYRQTTN